MHKFQTKKANLYYERKHLLMRRCNLSQELEPSDNIIKRLYLTVFLECSVRSTIHSRYFYLIKC